MKKEISHHKFLSILILSLLGISLAVLPAESKTYSDLEDNLSLNYVVSDAMGITQDSQFEDYGFAGNGSESDPYIIENLKINSDEGTGIYISFTTKFFIIRDCLVDAFDHGIFVNNVASGTAKIINNTCKSIKGGIGIFALDTNNITISGNICENNYYGIIIDGCENTTFINNECGFNTEPIVIYSCPNSYIFNNSVDFCSEYGMNIYNSNHSIVANNTIYKIGSNSYYEDFGFYIQYCSDLLIQYNTIVESGQGIYLFGVLESEILENVIIRCSSYGVTANWNSFDWPSENNIFHHNFFIENAWFVNWWDGAGYSSQAFDRGTNSVWYDINTNVGNYWSNYTGTGVYNIEEASGETLYYDPYPMEVIDTDSDGLDDIQEVYVYFTNPYNNDTDGDQLLDGEEVEVYLTDPHNSDSDFDGLTDGDEVYIYSTNPAAQDSDGDQLLDGEEIFLYGTDPNRRDTDGDTIPDGWEAVNGINPLIMDAEDDPDTDGLINLDEFEEQTNPLNNDTDQDFLTDGLEVHASFSSPLNNDTDDDGALDGVEFLDYGCNPNVKDTDGDKLDDGDEILVYLTSPTDVDSDHDGCDDGWEVKYNFDPLDDSDNVLDPDEDDLTNAEEYTYGTHPRRWDTDEDDFSDGHEVRVGTNPLLITDHPMYREDIIKMGVGIGLASAGVVGVIFYILIKKKIIRFKK